MATIEGLRIDVKAAEMKKLLLARLEYHRKRKTHYEQQAKKLAQIDAALAKEAETFSKTSNASPAETMQAAIKKHYDQAIYYKFMAEHVIAGATYRLSENDLFRLGVNPERHY